MCIHILCTSARPLALSPPFPGRRSGEIAGPGYLAAMRFEKPAMEFPRKKSFPVLGTPCGTTRSTRDINEILEAISFFFFSSSFPRQTVPNRFGISRISLRFPFEIENLKAN